MDKTAVALVAGILVLYLGLVVFALAAAPHPWGLLAAVAITGKAGLFYALVQRVARAGPRRAREARSATRTAPEA